MKKEVLSPNPLITDFINSLRQSEISREDKLKAEREHQKNSLFLYGASEKLLDRYGKDCSKQLAVASGEGRYGMHFETVNFRSTPIISMETEKEEILLMIAEDFTTGSNYYKKKDRIVISVLLDANWTDLLDISQTNKETKNRLGKRAIPEQILGAKKLLSDIEKSLKEEYGEKINKTDLKKNS